MKGTFFFFFLSFCPTQNAANGEKTFEALLGHVISELSKDKCVYNMNAEETPMVSG